jgi:hypothetical protein
MIKKKEVSHIFYTHDYCPNCDIILTKGHVYDPLHPLFKYTCSICGYMNVTHTDYPIIEVVFEEEK